jgi:hypothetical protein
MSKLSLAQTAALKKLSSNNGSAVIHVSTGSSLVKHGYATYVGGRSEGPATSLYKITEAGKKALQA